jgi:hypothetical protein
MIDLTEESNLPAIKANVDAVVARIAGLTITSDAEMVVAAEMLKDVKAALNAVSKHFTPIKREADAKKKEILDEEKVYTVPLVKGETAIKGILSSYQRKVEEDRWREKIKLEAEAKRLLEERVLNEAIQTGDETALDTPIEAPVVMQERQVKVEGVSYIENWTFEITDPLLIPREYLAVDEKMIRQVVKAMKGSTSIPGVRVYSEKTVRAVA